MSRFLVDVHPLRVNRAFRWLFVGQFASLLGSNLTIVAVPYQVYRETHSSLWVGLASLIQLPPLVAGSLWGGALGDRGDRRVLLVASSLALSACSAGLALNAATHRSHLAVLLVLAAFSAGAGGFGGRCAPRSSRCWWTTTSWSPPTRSTRSSTTWPWRSVRRWPACCWPPWASRRATRSTRGPTSCWRPRL